MESKSASGSRSAHSRSETTRAASDAAAPAPATQRGSSRAAASKSPRSPSAFVPTDWGLVARAGAADRAQRTDAQELLCKHYWQPLYVWCRRRGLAHADAADAVQGVFAELIAKRSFQRADPSKGRFRAWLLTSLKYFLSNQRAREATLKRGGPNRVSLDRLEQRWDAAEHERLSPDRAFDRAWALTVLQRARAAVAEKYAAMGKARWFEELQPRSDASARAPRLDELAERLGISEPAARNAAARLRRELREAIRAEVRATLTPGSDVEDELRHLRSVLQR